MKEGLLATPSRLMAVSNHRCETTGVKSQVWNFGLGC